MKTITTAAPKGGTGKSSVCSTLAWCAAGQPESSLKLKAPAKTRAVMIDLNDDQGTLTQWWELRGRPGNPYLLKNAVGRLDEDIAVLRGDGWDYCFIDAPPLDMEMIETAVYVADVVLIPVMASFFDTSAIDSIVDMCKRRRKPFAFLFNSWDGRKAFKYVNDEATRALRGRGSSQSDPILKARISYNAKYREAQSEGKVGPELDEKLLPEVNALWLEVQQKLIGSTKPTLVKGAANG